jgi:hypothetical protein
VHIIGAFGFNQGNFNNTFDNDRAILCVEARDSNGTLVLNQVITWTTTDGCLLSNVTNTGATANVNNANNELRSCGTGMSGDVATVTADIGSASDSVQVAFGGDPVECTMALITPDPLDIGDNADVDVTVLDAEGNPVPDGIVVNFVEVDSGDGADNVQIVDAQDDTVNGMAHASVIGAIAGLTTIAANVDALAGEDPVCSEALEISGDIHVTPHECEDPDMILFGNKPPAGGGFGTFAFCGGTYEQLLDASDCPAATAVFFYNKPDGGFAVWIPGTDVESVNDEIFMIFPNVHTPIPEGTIFTAKCK